MKWPGRSSTSAVTASARGASMPPPPYSPPRVRPASPPALTARTGRSASRPRSAIVRFRRSRRARVWVATPSQRREHPLHIQSNDLALPEEDEHVIRLARCDQTCRRRSWIRTMDLAWARRTERPRGCGAYATLWQSQGGRTCQHAGSPGPCSGPIRQRSFLIRARRRVVPRRLALELSLEAPLAEHRRSA